MTIVIPTWVLALLVAGKWVALIILAVLAFFGAAFIRAFRGGMWR